VGSQRGLPAVEVVSCYRYGCTAGLVGRVAAGVAVPLPFAGPLPAAAGGRQPASLSRWSTAAVMSARYTPRRVAPFAFTLRDSMPLARTSAERASGVRDP